MNKKLEKIYEAISDKTLNTGCLVKVKPYKEIQTIQQAFTAGGVKEDRHLGDENKDELFISFIGYSGDVSEKNIQKVIGHPVMIGDIIRFLDDVLERKYGTISFASLDDYKVNLHKILEYRYDTRKSIDKQDKECIDFIYRLIENDSQNGT